MRSGSMSSAPIVVRSASTLCGRSSTREVDIQENYGRQGVNCWLGKRLFAVCPTSGRSFEVLMETLAKLGITHELFHRSPKRPRSATVLPLLGGEGRRDRRDGGVFILYRKEEIAGTAGGDLWSLTRLLQRSQSRHRETAEPPECIGLFLDGTVGNGVDDLIGGT